MVADDSTVCHRHADSASVGRQLFGVDSTRLTPTLRFNLRPRFVSLKNDALNSAWGHASAAGLAGTLPLLGQCAAIAKHDLLNTATVAALALLSCSYVRDPKEFSTALVKTKSHENDYCQQLTKVEIRLVFVKQQQQLVPAA